MRRHICHTPALRELLCWGRGGGVAGALSFRAGAPPATKARRRVDPGNARRRPARRRRRARDQRSERCLRYRCSAAHLCEPASRGQQKAQTTCANLSPNFAFGRSFSSRCSKGFKMGARATDRRCCTLNRSLVISSFVFRPPPKLADPLPDPHENELSEDDRPAQERLEPALVRSAHRNNPLEAAPAIEPHSAPLGSRGRLHEAARELGTGQNTHLEPYTRCPTPKAPRKKKKRS